MRHNWMLQTAATWARACAVAGPRQRVLGGLVLILAACGVAGAVSGNGDALPRARLNVISAKTVVRGASVTIEASEPVAYVTSRPDPLTILVDLRHASTEGAVNRMGRAPVGPVAAVVVEDARASDGAPLARVRVLLSQPVVHKVRSERHVIQLDVESGGGLQADAPSLQTAKVRDGEAADAQPPAAEAKPAPVQAPVQPVARATRLTGLRVGSGPRGVEVTMTGNGALQATPIELTRSAPHRLVLDFAGVVSAVPAATPVGQGVVERVRVAAFSAAPLVTRVVFDLTRSVPYSLRPSGHELTVAFDDAAVPSPTVAPAKPADPERRPAAAPLPPPAADATAVPAAIPPSAPSATRPAVPKPSVDPARPPGEPARPAGEAPKAAAIAPPAVQQAPAPPGQPAPPTQPPPTMPPAASPATTLQQPAQGGQPSRYTGAPISFEFAGADLRAVLRVIAEESGLNLVIDPQVTGTVDIQVRDVPWDQVLDSILRANKLGYVVDGTIVRIAPIAVLAEEEAARRKLAEEQALSGDLKVMTHALSYSKAEQMTGLLTKTALTKRGDVQVDPRTNTLIIRDLPAALETARALLEALDKPQPQVQIEAKVVQTNRDWARTIGVQWGISGRMAPALGNTTSLAFPNSASLTGRTGGVQAGVGDTTGAATAVSMPASNATSAIGLSLGAINGAFNLDVALSALEKSGKGRILSTPTVMAQNNEPAEVMQGTQIPIQTVSNNTISVTFKDAALLLKVTPQITASNTIILSIYLENAAPDYSRAVGTSNIPPIDTQRAQSKVLVKDGETTAIGGVFISREQSSNDRTPGVSRIPLLGWLFKRDAMQDESRELLIFITPRIVKM